MAETPTITVRLDSETRAAIEARAGQRRVGAWLREAARQRLQAERDLGPQLAEIGGHWQTYLIQLRGITANLNQLAKHANEGRPVQIDDALLRALLGEVAQGRAALADATAALRGQGEKLLHAKAGRRGE